MTRSPTEKAVGSEEPLRRLHPSEVPIAMGLAKLDWNGVGP